MKKCFAKGGGVKKYTPDVPVEKEAMERKRGGRASKKKDMKVDGKEAPMRTDKRARGGRTNGPLSAASSISQASNHKTSDKASVNSEDD